MLVLNRKTNEEIMIGGAIRVIVLKVGRGKVKLGLTAPSDVAIYREELCRDDRQTATPVSKLDRGQPCPGRVEGEAWEPRGR